MVSVLGRGGAAARRLWSVRRIAERFHPEGDPQVLALGGRGHDVAQRLDSMTMASNQIGRVLGVKKDVIEQAIILLRLGDGDLIPVGDQRSDHELEAFTKSQWYVHG